MNLKREKKNHYLKKLEHNAISVQKIHIRKNGYKIFDHKKLGEEFISAEMKKKVKWSCFVYKFSAIPKTYTDRWLWQIRWGGS